MKLHHFVHRAIDGAWHAVYRTPGCDSLTSIGHDACRKRAGDLALEANHQQNLHNGDISSNACREEVTA